MNALPSLQSTYSEQLTSAGTGKLPVHKIRVSENDKSQDTIIITLIWLNS